MSDITIISGQDLTNEQKRIWHQILCQQDTLNSPFLCPEFTEIVSRHRANSRVAFFVRSDEIIGIFPFVKKHLGLARPIGEIISDYHGIITNQPDAISTKALLRACGLQIWPYNHGIAQQSELLGRVLAHSTSPILDLTDGLQDYKARKLKRLNRIKRQERQLERELGPIRFVAHQADEEIFHEFLRLKRLQAVRKSEFDVLKVDWVRNVLRDIHSTQTLDFAGMLSVLYVQDSIAAIHFGMRSRNVWHYWFPAYDKRYARFSPGLIMMMRMIEMMPEHNVAIMDFGKGIAQHKQTFMTGEYHLIEGYLERSLLYSAAFRSLSKAKQYCRKGYARLAARRIFIKSGAI